MGYDPTIRRHRGLFFAFKNTDVEHHYAQDFVPFPDLSTPCAGVIDKISIMLRSDLPISRLYLKILEMRDLYRYTL